MRIHDTPQVQFVVGVQQGKFVLCSFLLTPTNKLPQAVNLYLDATIGCLKMAEHICILLTCVFITTFISDRKHLESFEICCWRRMEKISWTDHVRNEEVLLTVKEQRNILQEINKRKANWIGQILRRNCLLQRVIERKINGSIEVTGRRGRRRRKLLDELKESRGYWKFEGGSSRSQCVESSLWKRLWTCRKTDY